MSYLDRTFGIFKHNETCIISCTITIYIVSFIQGPGASDKPCSNAYRGDVAFSEVEIRNVAKFLKSKGSTLKAYMDVHSYSQFWLMPIMDDPLGTIHK